MPPESFAVRVGQRRIFLRKRNDSKGAPNEASRSKAVTVDDLLTHSEVVSSSFRRKDSSLPDRCGADRVGMEVVVMLIKKTGIKENCSCRPRGEKEEKALAWPANSSRSDIKNVSTRLAGICGKAPVGSRRCPCIRPTPLMIGNDARCLNRASRCWL